MPSKEPAASTAQKSRGVRRASLFRRTDVVRAVRAARDAGEVVDRVEIDQTGKIIIVITDKPGAPASDEEVEKWVSKNARRS